MINKKRKDSLYFKKIYNKYSKLLYLILFSFSISPEKHCLDKIISDTEIILTIKGKGNQPILNNQSIQLWDSISQTNKSYTFNELPSEIFVNGDRINTIDFYLYNLTLNENKITIKFNKTLTNCNVMFSKLSNITKIYFKKFDFSGINMIGIFYDCNNLKSLDISNFNTSSVTNMEYMFYNCNNLKTLDLSNFNISSLTNMRSMFYDCNNLISLDLSNFNTSSVTNMEYLFYNC